MIKYSIIIPTLNEEFYIIKNINKLLFYKNIEIIIADGGSSDKTIDIVKEKNVKIIYSLPGRGIQLNGGANEANGEIICFLHADTFLPLNAFNLLDKFFENSNNNICRFKLGFDVEHFLLDKYKSFSKFDSIFTRFGDMFIAVRKDFYINIGGFPNKTIFEDVEFLRKASKFEKVKIIDAEVVSSARTFIKYGIIKQQLFNGYSMIKYLIGFRKFIKENKYYKRNSKLISSLIVFVRYPTKGKVKTRLASSIGENKTTSIYKILAENVIKNFAKVKNTNKYVFYSDESEKILIKKWLGKKFIFSTQEGDNLGERMKNSFEKVFSHGANKVIIIGTDIPDLTTEVINNAILKLEHVDVVIGPSDDGGYYLLGMKKYFSEFFENINYSTNEVFSKTINKIDMLGLTFETLPLLQDIDTKGDLEKWLIEGKNEKLKTRIKQINE